MANPPSGSSVPGTPRNESEKEDCQKDRAWYAKTDFHGSYSNPSSGSSIFDVGIYRRQRLALVVNNSRFLVRKEGDVPGRKEPGHYEQVWLLASHPHATVQRLQEYNRLYEPRARVAIQHTSRATAHFSAIRPHTNPPCRTSGQSRFRLTRAADMFYIITLVLTCFTRNNG